MKKTINEDTFEDIFKPQINHFERAKAKPSIKDEDLCGFSGCLYETYGEDIDYVFNLAKTTKRIWTIVEGENDTLFYRTGFRIVNRLGFLVCEKEYRENQKDIQIDTNY